MESYSNILTQDEWALIISLVMLVFFVTAFFFTASQRKGKRKAMVLADEGKVELRTESEAGEEEITEYETVTNWITLRHAGALSPTGNHGHHSLSQSGIPKEFRDLMQEIGLEITITDIKMRPERHVQLEVSVNEKGFFEAGKRKGPSPFEYTLPRVTHSTVSLNIWQPFINHNKEQVFSQIRFGRLQDAGEWRIVFEIQHITDNFSHIDYEIYWDRVMQDKPASVRLGALNKEDLPLKTEVFFRK